MKFFDWHQRQTEWWLDRLGMTPYAALWFAYVKGAVTTLLVLWLLGYFSGKMRVVGGGLRGKKHAPTGPGRTVRLLA